MKANKIIMIIIGILVVACEGYLDVKPDQKLIVPTTLEDLQALLDYDFQKMNQDLALGFIGSDNYYIPYNSWQTLYTQVEKNGYIWAKDVYEGSPVTDWNMGYEHVFISNVVLEGLEDIDVTEANRTKQQQLQGSALFFRSYAFYNLLQYFAVSYDPATAGDQVGIPLKLSSQLDDPVYRENLQVCYNEVIRSLKTAATLLPETSDYKTRPSKAAAYGCLARIYLIMQDYEQAENFATSCLDLQNSLLSYKDMDTTSLNPFEPYNEEVIFHSVNLRYNIFDRALVAPELYSSYDLDDLRRALFYDNDDVEEIRFKGSYGPSRFNFSGLAVDEIYLIRAECRARLNNMEGAMADLNTLLKSRYQEGTYTDQTASDTDDALKIILDERRKELAFRGLRWSDLRRLNQDERFAITLEREWEGVEDNYTLPPNDPRYVYPIPMQEIEISGIEQNER